MSKFNCLECIGYCCAIYDYVSVKARDIRRLARHFNISYSEAEERFTLEQDGKRMLQRSPDPIFEESCIFQDPIKRVCTIYEARPETCRGYPGTKRCVYYDVLTFERKGQRDRYIPLVVLTFSGTDEERPD